MATQHAGKSQKNHAKVGSRQSSVEIATPSLCSARNDKFKIYNGDKNNFAILNLVKSFLTLVKITFDNLSRKIKNPCLVINKNLFSRSIFMKNIKQFFTYLVVGALVIALSISCKSNEEPTSGDNGDSYIIHSDHPPAGDYVSLGEKKAATVENVDGTCRIKGEAQRRNNNGQGYEYKSFDITITKWYRYNSTSYAGSGSLYEQSGTINSPSGVDNFSVDYNHENGRLEIRFGPLTESYHTVIEKKQ